jgi:hypothetical protein
MQFLYDQIPKFRQECRPKCRPIPKDYKTAETDTETDISAEISADTDTETDNFRSLVILLLRALPVLNKFIHVEEYYIIFNFRLLATKWLLKVEGFL